MIVKINKNSEQLFVWLWSNLLCISQKQELSKLAFGCECLKEVMSLNSITALALWGRDRPFYAFDNSYWICLLALSASRKFCLSWSSPLDLLNSAMASFAVSPSLSKYVGGFTLYFFVNNLISFVILILTCPLDNNRPSTLSWIGFGHIYYQQEISNFRLMRHRRKWPIKTMGAVDSQNLPLLRAF